MTFEERKLLESQKNHFDLKLDKSVHDQQRNNIEEQNINLNPNVKPFSNDSIIFGPNKKFNNNILENETKYQDPPSDFQIESKTMGNVFNGNNIRDQYIDLMNRQKTLTPKELHEKRLLNNSTMRNNLQFKNPNYNDINSMNAINTAERTHKHPKTINIQEFSPDFNEIEKPDFQIDNKFIDSKNQMIGQTENDRNLIKHVNMDINGKEFKTLNYLGQEDKSIHLNQNEKIDIHQIDNFTQSKIHFEIPDVPIRYQNYPNVDVNTGVKFKTINGGLLNLNPRATEGHKNEEIHRAGNIEAQNYILKKGSPRLIAEINKKQFEDPSENQKIMNNIKYHRFMDNYGTTQRQKTLSPMEPPQYDIIEKRNNTTPKKIRSNQFRKITPRNRSVFTDSIEI